MASNTDLVIVESPSKAKTIGKYLGPGYEVKASMGHVRDLPKSKLGVDIEDGFVPDYQPIKGKGGRDQRPEKGGQEERQGLSGHRPGPGGGGHLLASEGAAGHPRRQDLPGDLQRDHQKGGQRVHRRPRAIDQNLVDAQQARRILDRIVGYELSPLLWKKIRRGLSAGRVQSVATRLVVEREEEIRAFQPQEYWSILRRTWSRVRPNLGASGHVPRPGEEDGAEQRGGGGRGVQAVSGQPFTVSKVKRQDKKRNPAPLHHLHPPAGGLPQAEHDPCPHHVHRPAAL